MEKRLDKKLREKELSKELSKRSDKRLGLWFDAEGDFLEFTIGKPRKGFFRPINGDMFERVDAKTGKVLGFAIFNFTKRFKKVKKPEELKLPVTVELKPTKK